MTEKNTESRTFEVNGKVLTLGQQVMVVYQLFDGEQWTDTPAQEQGIVMTWPSVKGDYTGYVNLLLVNGAHKDTYETGHPVLHPMNARKVEIPGHGMVEVRTEVRSLLPLPDELAN